MSVLEATDRIVTLQNPELYYASTVGWSAEGWTELPPGKPRGRHPSRPPRVEPPGVRVTGVVPFDVSGAAPVAVPGDSCPDGPPWRSARSVSSRSGGWLRLSE